MTDTATALAEAASAAADQLTAAARVHKQSEFAHRRQARALMQSLDRLRRICEEHGIELVVKAPGGTDR